MIKRITQQLAVIAAVAAAGHAAPLFYADASVFTRGNGVTKTSDSGQIAGPVANAGPIGFSTVLPNGASFTSDASAMATYGHLSASASAAQILNNSFPVQSDAGTGEQFGFGATSFFDTLTLTSATIPVGTFVDIFFNLQFTYSASAGPSTCCGNAGITGMQQLGAGVFNFGFQASPGQTLSGTVQKQAHLQWAIGTAYQIGAILSLSDGSSPGVNSNSGQSASSADALFDIQLPQDVVLNSASGAAYSKAIPAASVPEPCTAAMMLAAGMLHLLRRTKR